MLISRFSAWQNGKRRILRDLELLQDLVRLGRRLRGYESPWGEARRQTKSIGFEDAVK